MEEEVEAWARLILEWPCGFYGSVKGRKGLLTLPIIEYLLLGNISDPW